MGQEPWDRPRKKNKKRGVRNTNKNWIQGGIFSPMDTSPSTYTPETHAPIVKKFTTKQLPKLTPWEAVQQM